MIKSNIGILLTQIGTPDAPTVKDVRRYLRKFLSDPRVIEVPKLIWWPILYGFILRVRPKRSLELYQEIWTEQGSPLLIYSENIRQKLEARLQVPVALGMHYSNPSIANGLKRLREKGSNQIIILPLFPQYSGTTTASAFDMVNSTLKKWRVYPEIRTISEYHNHPEYIQAIVNSIQQSWEQNGRGEHLLFSYHGIPESYSKKGDPYADLCRRTTELIAKSLQLKNNDWSIAFQSRIGRTKWVGPYTDEVFQALGEKGISHLEVVCPGFATDCLETLEEIKIRGRKQFEAAGGKKFQYIPALNDSTAHIEMLAKVIAG